MAQFSQQEQNAMRREAARRAREMQKRVYFGKQQGSSPYADYPPEEPPQEKTPSPKSGKLSADEFRLDVENPHQPEATLFKADVFRNHFSQTACTDHDRRKLFRQTHDLL